MCLTHNWMNSNYCCSYKESPSAPSLHHMQPAAQRLRNNCCMCHCTGFSHHSLPLLKEDNCKNIKVDSKFSGHFDAYLIGTLALNHTTGKKMKSEQNTKMSHFYQRFWKSSCYRYD